MRDKEDNSFMKMKLEVLDYFNRFMTNELANEIFELRQKGTWRYVSQEIAKRYPNLKITSGDQLDGKWLCESASYYLHNGEDERWKN